jgi:hypothetical protein
MSKVSTVPRPPQRFDLQKFETMNEPFTILVQKQKGNTRHDVTPPVADDDGWTKERVRALETWIVNEWSGGGHYVFAITDSSVPAQAMEWTSFYPPSDFPEKIPLTLQQAASHQPQQQQQPPQQQQQPYQNHSTPQQTGSVTHLRANVLPPASYFAPSSAQQPQQQQQPQAQQQPQPQPQQIAPAYQSQPMQNFPQPLPAPLMTESAELRLLREQLAQTKEQAAQRDYDRRVAEMKAESDKRFTELQALMQSQQQQFMQQMQQMQLQLQQQQARPAVDPAVEELKLQNRALQDQMRIQKEQSDQLRREQELRDQIKAGQEETRRLVEAANLRYEAIIRDAGSKGPDPQFMMMMQVMKDIASSSTAQFDRLQNMMMRPQDILAMAQASTSAGENVASGITRQFESMFGLQRQLIEQAAQLNQGQGGNEVIGLIKDVGEKVGEWAGRYSTGKSREEVERMRSQAEVARANADAIKATQERMAEMARLEAALKSGAVVQMPDGTFRAGPGHEQAAIAAAPPANGAANGNGARKPPWAVKAPKKPAIEVVEPPAAGSGLSGAPAGSSVDSIPSSVPKPYGHGKIKGFTEDEWFGPMLPDVHRLRAAVSLFIQGVNETPPRKPDESAAPEECAFAINQAAAEIMRLQIPIKAVTGLLLEGSVADFLDLLLPDAPQVYRDDVVKLLMQGEDGDEDEDDGQAEAAS